MENLNIEFIKHLIVNKYLVYNVNENKLPILGSGSNGWSKITFENALKYHNYSLESWGFRTGIQPNEKFIIGLDFDMWYKTGGEYIASENTRKLFKDFEKLNNNKDGLFSSSTELNRGCLVDISKSKKIQEIIKINGKGKIEKKDFHLEVLTSFNMVLPPTTTKCKIRKTVTDKRTFLGENYFLEVEEDTEIETFIYNYLDDATPKKKITKSQMRNKEQKEAFYKFEETDKKELYVKNSKSILNFLNNISFDRVTNYNEWYKIGYCLKNSYKEDGLELFKEFSKRDFEGYNSEEVEKYYNSWSSDKYELLNSNYIISCLKEDNPEKFIYCLVKLEEEIFEQLFEELKIKFEENVRKVLEPSIWLKKNRKSKKWEITTYGDILHCYKEIKPFSKEFIDAYNACDTKNYYDCIDFIPKLDLEEEEGFKTFNLFDGFWVNTIETENLEKKDHYVNLFKQHIHYLANEDERTKKFILQWVAHLLLNTHKKSMVCLVIQGEEGSGKTSLYELMQKMMQNENIDKYCYMTAAPESTIFDKFNDVLLNKLLVNINEPEFSSFKGGFEKFKSLITDRTLNIESKGQPKLSIQNHATYILTTNNEKLFTLSATDRRFYFVKTSDKLIGDDKYWNEYYTCLEDECFSKYIMEYLKEVIDYDFNFKKNQLENKTIFHQLLVEDSKNPFFQFLQNTVEDENLRKKIEKINEKNNILPIDGFTIIQPKDLLGLYSRFCSEEKHKDLDTGKGIKFKLMKIDSQVYKKLNNKNHYKLNNNKIIEYLKKHKYYIKNTTMD